MTLILDPPFVPQNPPTTPEPVLSRYLREEFQRVRQTFDGARLPELFNMAVFNPEGTFTLNTNPQNVYGWNNGVVWGAGDKAFVDKSQGFLTLPYAGLWQVSAFVIGEQGNDTKEEAIEFGFSREGDGIRWLDVFDVATDKTDTRQGAFNIFYLWDGSGSGICRFWMRATAGLGTFTPLEGLFFIRLVYGTEGELF